MHERYHPYAYDAAAPASREKREAPTEIEIPFAIRRADLEQNIPLATLARHTITTHYVPSDKGVIREVIKRIPDFPFSKKDIGHLRNVRIRHMKTDESEIYSVALKGPKDPLTHTREEWEHGITQDIYTALQPLATDGSTEKERYILPGASGRDDARFAIHAEIDLIKAMDGEPVDVPLAIVGVEFPNETARRQFKNGLHTFAFLKNAVDITEVKTLRNRFLARGKNREEVTKTMQLIDAKLRAEPSPLS